MGDSENSHLRRSERNKNKRPVRFEDYYLGEPLEKMPRPNDENGVLDRTIRETSQTEQQQTENAPEQSDPFEEMRKLINGMAQTLSKSMDSMQTNIVSSRVSIQNDLRDNIAMLNNRVNDVQRNLDVSLSTMNLRLINLEKNPSSDNTSEPPTGVNIASTASQGISEPELGNSMSNDGLVRQLSKTLLDMNARRKLIELPKFSGDPEEWPQFIAQYKSTTVREGYSTIENNIRLGSALTGRAKELVKSLLIHHSNVPVIIERLEHRFGLPQHLVESQLAGIRRLEAINENNLQKLVPFADQVMNLRNFLENAGCAEYLNSPSLLKDLTLKLPYRERITWTHHSREFHPPSIKEFSDWLITLADDIHCTTLDDVPDKKRKVVLHVTDQDRPDMPCSYCSQDHQLENCSKFCDLNYELRLKTARGSGLCFCCLSKGHIAPYCSRKKRCGVDGKCKKFHHHILHEVKEANNEPALDPTAEPFEPHIASGTATAMTCSTNNNVKVWFKVVPVKVFGPKGTADIYALLDDGASVTMMNKEIASIIGAIGPKSSLNLKWLNDANKQISTFVTEIQIAGTFNKARKFNLHDVHIVEDMKLPQQTLKLDDMPAKYRHMKRLPIQEFSNAVPSLLIGLDNSHLGRSRGTQWKDDIGPIPIMTKLGYVVYGSLRSESEIRNEVRPLFLTSNPSEEQDDLHKMISRFFSTEDFGIKNLAPLESEDDLRAKQLLESTTTKLGSRYQSGLLWRKDKVELPNSYPMAVSRFYNIERKMKNDASYSEMYHRTIKDYLQKGYVKKLSPTEIKSPNGPVWYLPHFGVTNANKPNKFRLVFDGAASVAKVSLNSELLAGPDVNQPLVKVLSLFRERPIGVSADLKEMFHQIIIRPEDRDAQRFVWRDNIHEPLGIMRMEVMTFGSTSSPATAQFVKNTNSKLYENRYPEASKAIRDNHYVDDYVHCFSTEDEATRVSNEVMHIHRLAGFELRNFVSNSKKVADDLNKHSLNSTKDFLSLDAEDVVNPVDKILGLFWNVKDDTFTFHLTFHRIKEDILQQKRLPTKREFLSIIMSVFDPFGFLSNFTIQMKILLQGLWKVKSGWDDALPDVFAHDWFNWMNDLKDVTKFRIPRCMSRNLFNSNRVEWHTFVDASELAFAAVSYIRVISTSGEVTISFVCGKAKGAPLKPLSIPRMELQAAVLGVRMQKSMYACFSFKVDQFIFWSDSKTVLYWIKDNRRRYKQFVSNRVAEIIDSTNPENWFWVPSKDNVADDATKKKHGGSFNFESRWTKGPEWLETGNWPIQTDEILAQEGEDEVLTSSRLLLVDQSRFPINITNYSDYNRLKVHVAWLLIFKRYMASKFRKEKIEKHPYLKTSEMQESEIELYKYAQRQGFPEEVNSLQTNKAITKSSSLYKSMPYMDSDGLMRMFGRIDNAPTNLSLSKRPIILPQHHHLTDLIAKWYHERFAHQFEDVIMAEIRRKFYVSNLRKVVRRTKSCCVQCKLENAKPVQPMMGQLPRERLTPYIRPFSHTGVDYFGPITVSIGRRQEKRWAALFTCLTVRAVHVEIAENLSSDAFIMCLKNFVNLRGVPATLHSDNGTNFVGAKSEIIKSKEFFENMKIQGECSHTGIKWKFNNPNDPAAGGCWERLVQSIKRVLAKIMKDIHPRVETLRCFLLEAVNIVNSRPLTYLALSNSNEEPLTPNSFLLGCASSIQTPGPIDEKLWCLRKQWRIANSLKNHFWSLWIRDYLPTLTRRSKWCERVKPLQANDVVIICDDSLSPSLWQKGVITEVIQSKDNQVRSAVVRVNGKLLRRPASKLALLDIVKSSWNDDLPGGGCHLVTLA